MPSNNDNKLIQPAKALKRKSKAAATEKKDSKTQKQTNPESSDEDEGLFATCTAPAGVTDAKNKTRSETETPAGTANGPGDDSDASSDEGFGPMKTTTKSTSTKTSSTETTKPKETTIDLSSNEILACRPGTKHVHTGTILGKSVKYTNGDEKQGPCTVKITLMVTDASKNAGKDVIRAGPLSGIVKVTEEKKETPSGAHVYAKVIKIDVVPTIKPHAGVIQVTVSGLKGDKGTRETAAKTLVPGATVQLTELLLADHSGNLYLSCGAFKVTSKASDEAPREGVETAIDTVRKSGSALLLGGAFSCTEFRSDESSNPKAAGDFAKVKRELATAKDAYATAVAGDHPKYEKPTDKLLLNDKSSFQLTSTLCFYKTKVELTTGQGMLLNDAIQAAFLAKQGRSAETNSTFNGMPIVAADIGAFGVLHTRDGSEFLKITSTLSFVPDLTAIPTKSSHVLAVDGPAVLAPPAYFAAPFGVNERTTLELLKDSGVVEAANMVIAPAKDTIKADKYDESDYTPTLILNAACQLTIDVRSTLRNTAFKLSAKAVQKIFGGADGSTPAIGIGEDLVAACKEGKDQGHYPVLATLDNAGGVVSLRETAVELNDKTLEFYGVVPKMLVLSQGDGMLTCGTDAKVGDQAFLKQFGDKPAVALDSLKKGAAAIFAVRVKPVKKSVDAGPSSETA